MAALTAWQAFGLALPTQHEHMAFGEADILSKNKKLSHHHHLSSTSHIGREASLALPKHLYKAGQTGQMSHAVRPSSLPQQQNKL